MKYILFCFLFLFLSTMFANTFTSINTSMLGAMWDSAIWGDYDNDGYLDVLIAGFANSSIYISWLYHNNGNGTFTRVSSGIPSVEYSYAAWGDYNNDGYLDILLNGYDTNNLISRIYRNNGNGTFTDISAGLTGVNQGCCQWGDYDNDGDLDVLLTGSLTPGYGGNSQVSRLYRNNGNDTFTEVPAGLMGLTYSCCQFFDYDNDGDLDILITGGYQDTNGQYICESNLYRNDGNGSFILTNSGLTGVCEGSIAVGDYNNDGYLDLFLTGFTGTIDANRVSKLFRNNHDSTFTEITSDFIGVNDGGAATWGDFDNDGDPDIVLTGCYQENPTGKVTRLYSNDGNDIFTDSHAGFLDVFHSTVAWGDYDNDHDLDLLLTGSNTQTYAKLYQNNGGLSNTKPNAPTNLRVTYPGGAYVNFQWDTASDQQTPSNGLNYNLRIGSTPGGNQIVSSMSNSSGFRHIPFRGNANSNCSWKILVSALPVHFYWSVQAIDGAFEGSSFAPEEEGYSQAAVLLLTSSNVQFGNVVYEEQSNSVGVIIQNTGLNSLSISNIHFQGTQFHQNYSYLGRSIAPGDTATILVTFTPAAIGANSDTLYIESNAVNTPIVKVHLTGIGIHIPPKSPANLIVNIIDDDIHLTWDAVTQDTHNNPLITDYYNIYYNATSNPYGHYIYLDRVMTNQCVIDIGLQGYFKFYKISAVKEY